MTDNIGRSTGSLFELWIARTRLFSVLEVAPAPRGDHPSVHVHVHDVVEDGEGCNCHGPRKETLHLLQQHLQQTNNTNGRILPLIHLADILQVHTDLQLQQHNKCDDVDVVASDLWRFLEEFGYCFVVVSASSTPNTNNNDNFTHSSKSHREATTAAVRRSTNNMNVMMMQRSIQQMRTSTCTSFFPDDSEPAVHLHTSEVVYVSERDVPMYRLGYELCQEDDHQEELPIRQVFRVAAGGDPAEDVQWPSQCGCSKQQRTQTQWLQGLNVMRHMCDAVLDLLLFEHAKRSNSSSLSSSTTIISGYNKYVHHHHHHQTSTTLKHRHRPGDFSMLYVMHYFNHKGAVGVGCDNKNNEDMDIEKDMNYYHPSQRIAVKAHVDPSLLVLEPFLCQETTGLQLWDRSQSCWMDVDGPQSPVAHLTNKNEISLLFVGKSLAQLTGMEPTLHRVVIGHLPRRTVIYEQKYEELMSS